VDKVRIKAVFSLLQKRICFSDLTEVKVIAEGGFGVIHRAKHHRWGTVVYKKLKSSFIAHDSRFDIQCIVMCDRSAALNYRHTCIEKYTACSIVKNVYSYIVICWICLYFASLFIAHCCTINSWHHNVICLSVCL